MKQKVQQRNRRTRRRPRDDRVRKLRVSLESTYQMSTLLDTGLPRVRDCRLQSVRLVGGDTPTFKVYLSGGFVNGEHINLAVVQKTPLRLDRTLTVPERVRKYFLDSLQEGNESYVTIVTEDEKASLSYVEFTFLAESPPVLRYGVNSCTSTISTSGLTSAGAKEVRISPNQLKVGDVIEFTYSDKSYLCSVGRLGLGLELLAPPELADDIPQDTPLDWKFT